MDACVFVRDFPHSIFPLVAQVQHLLNPENNPSLYLIIMGNCILLLLIMKIVL
jgi:hypothetical protein